jgi:carbon-monoxide dehydrogenase medium subunit
MAYGAEILVWRSGGEKREPIEDFFKGPSENILEKGDILRGFFLRPGQEEIACYGKLGIRKALEIGIVNVCVAISIDGGGGCERLRIALGSVAPTPIRAKEAEKILEGKKISRDLVSQVIETTMGEARPISDIRASAEYRRYIVGVLVGEAFSRLIDTGSGRVVG